MGSAEKRDSKAIATRKKPEVRIPLKTAMIKYRENLLAEVEANLSSDRKKLQDTLLPYSSPQHPHTALNKERTSSMPGSTRKERSPPSSTKHTITVKPFFDPALTYVPPNQRGVVDVSKEDPRDRLKELYQHYKRKGDWAITSKFLRRRDWFDLPSRLKELKKR